MNRILITFPSTIFYTQSSYSLFADLKIALQGKTFDSNEERGL